MLEVKLAPVRIKSEGKSPQNAYIVYQPRRRPNIVKVWLTSVARCGCNNEAKTRNQLKFAGVPKTHQPISDFSRPMFTILCELGGGDISV